MGFQQLLSEPCIYQRGSALIIAYVDDLLITDDSDNLIDAVRAELSKSFKVEVIGEPAKFLGCAVARGYGN
jgi:hypothetical protein